MLGPNIVDSFIIIIIIHLFYGFIYLTELSEILVPGARLQSLCLQTRTNYISRMKFRSAVVRACVRARFG